MYPRPLSKNGWQEETERKGFDAGVKQLIKVHARCFKECGLAKSTIESWHLEFLRGVEFQNFTNAAKAAKVVKGINKKIKKKFFKVMIDAAHAETPTCQLQKSKGDSGFSQE